MDDDVIVRREERGLISVLTMEYRPYNLLGPTLIGAIATEVTAAHEAASRAIILRSGLRHFSAGADVALFGSRIEQGGRSQAVISGVDFLKLLELLPIPIVASVHGVCLGGGFELATMPLSRDLIDRLPHVEGILNYLAPMPEKPMNLAYDPPPGVPRSTGVPEPHRMTIYDARPVAAQLSLDSEGLALFEHKSAMRDFYDEDELRRVYYPEAERLVAEVTGASRVLVFDHTIRRRVWGGVDRAIGTPRQPVTSVHNDYTVYSGPQRVRDLMGEEADELVRQRFEFVNVWRPIRGPLRDAPLAVCDATTVAFTDFVASDLVYRDRTGETYRVTYNPAHRWFYVPEMQVDEAILIKCYDSAPDRARFTAHSAFQDPTAPADVLPRESIELRTLAFHAA